MIIVGHSCCGSVPKFRSIYWDPNPVPSVPDSNGGCLMPVTAFTDSDPNHGWVGPGSESVYRSGLIVLLPILCIAVYMRIFYLDSYDSDVLNILCYMLVN